MDVRAAFISLKDASCCSPYVQMFFLLFFCSSCHSGMVREARSLVNLMSWFTLPKNRWSSGAFLGAGKFMMPEIFAGSAYTITINDGSQEVNCCSGEISLFIQCEACFIESL